MAGLYIPNLDIPTDGTTIFAIRTDGMVEDVMGCYIGKAISVPDHGRLIDADALIAAHKEVCSLKMKFNLDLAPTIIEADKGGDV